jgi:hypothetical protein
MPSVKSGLRFKQQFQSMNQATKQEFVSETIVWLDRDVRPIISDTELQKLKVFQTNLQDVVSKEWIPDSWFSSLYVQNTTCFFFDRFIRRSIS